MISSTTQPARPLRLSREELTVVLLALNAPMIVGMDVEEISLSPDQQQLVLWTAQRALIARHLAGINRLGQFELHRALREMMVPCAFADRAVLVHYWPPQQQVPMHLFAHQRDGDLVMHTLPLRGQHEFTLLDSPRALVTAILNQRELDGTTPHTPIELSFAPDQLGEARTAAEEGKLDEAAAALGGTDEEASLAFVKTLSATPAITMLQIAQEDGQHQLTWLRDPERLWIMENRNGSGMLSARTATKVDLATRLMRLLVA